MVDDGDATAVLGAGGRGTAEQQGVLDRIDLITSTLGKALGGAVGGFTCGRAEVAEYRRQRSRPYLFSNSVPPPVAYAALTAVDRIAGSADLRAHLHAKARKLRQPLRGASW